jgi:hypothetical protein
MTIQIPRAAAAYVESINRHDPDAFNALFADGAAVDDAGRQFRGQAAIAAWSQTDIFDAQVTLDVIAVKERDGQTVLTTKVDGNFDRTGLPDPVIIDQHIATPRWQVIDHSRGSAGRHTCGAAGDAEECGQIMANPAAAGPTSPTRFSGPT